MKKYLIINMKLISMVMILCIIDGYIGQSKDINSIIAGGIILFIGFNIFYTLIKLIKHLYNKYLGGRCYDISSYYFKKEV